MLTDRPGVLTNDFFANLLAPGHASGRRPSRRRTSTSIRDRATGSQVDRHAASTCIFGSNSQLRALAEVYASDDAQEKFVRDFVAAWTKVMEADRFDVE